MAPGPPRAGLLVRCVPRLAVQSGTHLRLSAACSEIVLLLPEVQFSPL